MRRIVSIVPAILACCLLLAVSAAPVPLRAAGNSPGPAAVRGIAALTAPSPSPSPPATGKSGPVTITWLESSPAHPAIVYAGGYLGTPEECVDANAEAGNAGSTGCTLWAARSSDAGTTWQSLDGLGRLNDFYVPHAPGGTMASGGAQCSAARNPFLLSPNGSDLYLEGHGGLCGASSTVPATIGSSSWARSSDGGRSWAGLTTRDPGAFDAQPEQCCSADGPLAISPVDTKRLFVTAGPTGSGLAVYIARSDDTGVHWAMVAEALPTTIDDTDVAPLAQALMADPVSKAVVYMGLALDPIPTKYYRWVRSEDGGTTWHLVTPPFGKVPSGFLLETDRHLPGRIVAVPTGGSQPADRRYVSSDHGRTWQAIHCPGDWQGQCPAFTLEDVFGTGRSYGFYGDGVHAFTGSGSAGPRLGLSAQVPCKASSMIDVAGGGRTALVLCQDPGERLRPGYPPGLQHDWHLSGLLYRSTNGGHSWQQVRPEVSPPIPTPVS